MRDWLIASDFSIASKWNNVIPIYINLHTIHVKTSRVEKLDSGIVLLIEVCPQPYQINYWLFTGISSSGSNAMCTKRLLVTIKTKSLPKNIYKYTKPYNYLQVYLQKIETQNIEKVLNMPSYERLVDCIRLFNCV